MSPNQFLFHTFLKSLRYMSSLIPPQVARCSRPNVTNYHSFAINTQRHIMFLFLTSQNITSLHVKLSQISQCNRYVTNYHCFALSFSITFFFFCFSLLKTSLHCMSSHSFLKPQCFCPDATVLITVSPFHSASQSAFFFTLQKHHL